MGDRRAALLHPIALGALALLLVNDHILKAASPGWLTGKLSDVAALVVTPVVGAALWQAFAQRRHDEAWIAFGVGAWFAAVKLLPPANDVYAVLVGVVGWPLGVLGDIASGSAIQPIGRAPTVLDPGDLLALPAVAIGWWLAIGAPRHRSSRRVAHRAIVFRGTRPGGALALMGRVGVLATALFALVATTPSVPLTITSVAQDTVTVSGGGDAAQRSGTVTPAPRPAPLAGPDEGTSIRVQARPRWPLNDPPVRFTLTVEGFASATGPAPVVAVPPDQCGQACSLPVDVAIDWPDGAGRGSTSVAWELVVTTDAGPNSYLFSSGSNGATIVGAARTANGAGWLLGLLALAPLAALAVASGGRPRTRAARPEAARTLTIVVAVTSIAVITILVLAIASVASSPGIGSILGGPPDTLWYLGFAAVVAIGWGLFEWRDGSGVVLAATLGAIGLIGLPVAGILTAAASPSFAGPWLLIGLLLAVVLTVGAAVAALRPGDTKPSVTASHLFVLSSQSAVVVVLLVAAPGFFDGAGLLAAVLHGVALTSWWGGVGRWLGVTSFLIAAGTTAALFMSGPSLWGGDPWSPTSRAIQVGVLIGCVVGLGAALGVTTRRDPAAEDAAAEARIRELVAESPLAAPPGRTGDRESTDR